MRRRDRETVAVGGERCGALGRELVQAGRQRRQHAELVAPHAVGRAAPVDGGRQRGAELREQQVACHVPVRVVVGLEPVEVEQHEGARGVVVQRQRKIELQLAPVAQTGQGVRGGLDPARGEQRVVLAQRERHPDEHDAQRGGGQAQGDGVEVQRDAQREDPERERPAPDRNEQAGAGRRRPGRRRARRQRGGPREADHAGGRQGVGDRAHRPLGAGHVHQVRRLHRDDRGAQRCPQAVEPPARQADGADDRAQQDEVPDRIGEVRGGLPERRVGRPLDRERDRQAGQYGGGREAAGESVQARRPEGPPDATAGQREQRDVFAGVDREPEGIRDRGDRDGGEVRRGGVDEVARGGGQQARGQHAPGQACGLAADRARQATDGRGEDHGVVHPAAVEVLRAGAAEADQRVRPDRQEQRSGEGTWEASHLPG
ncbi:MAG TPA: hypothetical protein VF066_15050 [Thermoleophilaceae bacterium]